MTIKRLELREFRNYSHLELRPDERMTVFVGPNAAGKTNAIEAIQLVTAARSFRRPRWEDLVRWGADEARVRMSADGETGPVEVTLDVTAAGQWTFLVNGQAKRRVSDVAGLVPSVTFTPDDLDLAKGPAESRRAALDDLGEQLSAAYGAVRRDYAKVVRHRNALLKEPNTPDAEIAPWDQQMIALGSKLLVHRTRLLKRVAGRTAEIYAELAAGERLTMEYVSKLGLEADAWSRETLADEVAAAFAAELERRASDERARRVSLVGPHRDDVEFAIEGRGARSFGSQGQQRTIALAWKLAEVRVVEDVARREPVLLLDDVMSELDEDRRRALTDVVRRDVQTFVTTTNLGYFEPEMLEAASIVELER